MTKRSYLVKVAVDVEKLIIGEWRHETHILPVQVSATSKYNAVLEARKFYDQKENVEMWLETDIVSSEILGIVRVELAK